MKKYQMILRSSGFKKDWQEGTRLQYSNDTVLMDVWEHPDGYHEFAVCPKICFDRWENSRHINFRLMVQNYSKETKCGWTKKQVNEDFEQNVKDALWLCTTIPERMFSRFITIDLG